MNQLKRKQTEWIEEQSVSLEFFSEEPITPLHQKVPLGDRHKTLIVIPSFNEEASIGQVLEDVKQNAPEIPVLVVSDGCIDQTAQIAEEHGAQVISLPYNSGYGVALQTGFLYARKHNYSIVVQMDADGQHDPACIQDLLSAVNNSDVDVAVSYTHLRAHET